jgi:ABC-2 type transport system permease protein
MQPTLTTDAARATAAPTAAPARPSALSGLRWAVTDAVTIMRRNLTQIRRQPEKLSDVTIQPIMFVVLFAYVFGGAIALPGGVDYNSFLMAGIFVQSIGALYISTSIGMADDMAKGIMDRFRSLPISRAAVLLGRTGSDLLQATLGAVVLACSGLVIGWRLEDGLLRGLAGFALVLAFGYAMSWVGVLIGLSVRSVEGAQAIGFIGFFPLTFLSNAFVPTATMPRVLQVIAEWNPISAVTAACRMLFGNDVPELRQGAWPLQHPVEAALIWTVLILAVFMPAAIWKYRQVSTR